MRSLMAFGTAFSLLMSVSAFATQDPNDKFTAEATSVSSAESVLSTQTVNTSLHEEDAYSLAALKKISVNQLKINAQANQPEAVKDPLMPLNRKVFAFNEYLDEKVARPLAVQYVRVIPQQIRETNTNFQNNLREPWSGINQVLQAKPRVAAKSFARVALNTLTSLGFVDLANKRKITSEKDDFGMTLGVWGVPSGAYVMLPFFGPKTLRDTLGYAVDSFGNPQRKVFDSVGAYSTFKGLDILGTRADLLSVDDIFQGDHYALIRDAYLQQRSSAIAVRRGEDISNTLFSDDPFSNESQP